MAVHRDSSAATVSELPLPSGLDILVIGMRESRTVAKWYVPVSRPPHAASAQPQWSSVRERSTNLWGIV